MGESWVRPALRSPPNGGSSQLTEPTSKDMQTWHVRSEPSGFYKIPSSAPPTVGPTFDRADEALQTGSFIVCTCFTTSAKSTSFRLQSSNR